MNIQWWKQSEFNHLSQRQEKQLGLSQKLEKYLTSPTKERKGKTLSISNFFQWKEAAQFTVGIAKFNALFDVNVNQVESLKNLREKQKNFLQKYNFENILADTNRKAFSKFYQKSVNPPLNFPATLGNDIGIVLIIQSQPQQQKSTIKFLNFQGYIHSILSNVDPCKQFDKFKNHLKQKYKRFKNIVCFDRRFDKYGSKEFLNFFVINFNQVVFVLGNHQQMPSEALPCNRTIELQGRTIQITSNQFISIFRTHRLGVNSYNSLRNFHRKYYKIDQIIHQQIKNLQQFKVIFRQNQLYISYYGLYYNFINLSGLQNEKDTKIIQNMILSLFIKEKDKAQIQLEEVKEPLHRKLGHYPQKILQGCKVCCVCQAGNKKKSRFKCQKCSQTYSKDISICIEHFRQYHHNIYKYIPRGVKKIVKNNEIMQFNQSADQFNSKKKQHIYDQLSSKKKQPSQHSHNTTEQSVLDILSKWENKLSKSVSSFNILSSLMIQNNNLNGGYVPDAHQVSNQYYYLNPLQQNQINKQAPLLPFYYPYVKLENLPQAKIEEQ